MNKKLNVTVGIPAYNEEANIGHLLNDLLKQEQDTVSIEEIIIYSDGSSDSTVEIVKSFNKTNFQIIDYSERRGVAFGLNAICREAESEILVVLNADIQIKDKQFLKKLIKPISDNRSDLVSCRISELSPNNFFEDSLYTSMGIKREIFESYRNGINVYTCHGRARAFF